MGLGLSVRGLCVQRGHKMVIDCLDWDVPAQGWIGLIGANGSGKTTLLKAMAGHIALGNGTICWQGSALPTRYERARALRLAPDSTALPGSLLAGQVLDFFAQESGVMVAQPALADLYAALGIARLLALRIRDMSAGMRQRVALYAAFLTQTRVILLDEPFNWLDPVASYDLKQVLAHYTAHKGYCVITALHDMATLIGWCREGILLRNGQIVYTLNVLEIAAARADFAAFEQRLIGQLRG